MINFIKEQLMVWRLKKSFRVFAQPDPVFLKSARTRFVTLAQQKAGVTVRAQHPRLWKYATMAIVAVFSMTSGMAVFADANNVPATHPLYGFKRISEQVRMGLSSPVQQVELHRVFAHRRLEEVSELETENDDNPIPSQSQIQIDKLNKDFENETETGLDKAKAPQVKKETRQQFCQDILNTIKSRPNKIQNRMAERVKIRCDEDVDREKNAVDQEED